MDEQIESNISIEVVDDKQHTDLPCHEADGFYDCGLDDFFTRKDPPSHGIRPLGRRVGVQITTFVDDIIGDTMISFDVGKQDCQQLWGDKKFEVCLWVYGRVQMHAIAPVGGNGPFDRRSHCWDPNRRLCRRFSRRSQRVES